ncbi:MAG: serine protease, partial [Acetobacteraceae bacterium]
MTVANPKGITMSLLRIRSLRAAALAGSALMVLPLAATVAVSVPAPPAFARPAPDSFADLAAKLLPAVVNISSTTEVKTGSGGPDMPVFPPGSPFEQFFKDFMNRHRAPGGEPQPQERRMQSLGSGFIIDPSGMV